MPACDVTVWEGSRNAEGVPVVRHRRVVESGHGRRAVTVVTIGAACTLALLPWIFAASWLQGPRGVLAAPPGAVRIDPEVPVVVDESGGVPPAVLRPAAPSALSSDAGVPGAGVPSVGAAGSVSVRVRGVPVGVPPVTGGVPAPPVVVASTAPPFGSMDFPPSVPPSGEPSPTLVPTVTPEPDPTSVPTPAPSGEPVPSEEPAPDPNLPKPCASKDF